MCSWEELVLQGVCSTNKSWIRPRLLTALMSCSVYGALCNFWGIIPYLALRVFFISCAWLSKCAVWFDFELPWVICLKWFAFGVIWSWDTWSLGTPFPVGLGSKYSLYILCYAAWVLSSRYAVLLGVFLVKLWFDRALTLGDWALKFVISTPLELISSESTSISTFLLLNIRLLGPFTVLSILGLLLSMELNGFPTTFSRTVIRLLLSFSIVMGTHVGLSKRLWKDNIFYCSFCCLGVPKLKPVPSRWNFDIAWWLWEAASCFWFRAELGQFPFDFEFNLLIKFFDELYW